jgi:hypothetical protein
MADLSAANIALQGDHAVGHLTKAISNTLGLARLIRQPRGRPLTTDAAALLVTLRDALDRTIQLQHDMYQAAAESGESDNTSDTTRGSSKRARDGDDTDESELAPSPKKVRFDLDLATFESSTT